MQVEASHIGELHYYLAHCENNPVSDLGNNCDICCPGIPVSHLRCRSACSSSRHGNCDHRYPSPIVCKAASMFNGYKNKTSTVFMDMVLYVRVDLLHGTVDVFWRS